LAERVAASVAAGIVESPEQTCSNSDEPAPSQRGEDLQNDEPAPSQRGKEYNKVIGPTES
jgi:hypothetical protein